ncbi:S-layer homology domain-containing protein [Almyronema epifaneia]|uniref:S-layer homology domain-containing protein n=1 Tax=Almyronema epifaneia S1 TaxID=2991925 RepID=A0ABW6ICA1_9CYAN
MNIEQDWSIRKTTTLIGALAAIATVPGLCWLSAEAQTVYPDVAADYWAQPFIQQLSQADILTGYPDGTFRPQQPIDRDEYAAVIRQAFETALTRSLPQGSTFEDVPENYWASTAIEEAYEMGFMDAPVPNEFEPQTEITRANAIVALVEGLSLQEAPVVAVPAATETVQPVRQRRRSPNRLAFPLASTAMMHLFAPPVTAATPAVAASSTSAAADIDLSQYYADADQIPAEAQDEVALATQNGLIVNYPDPTLLNPNQPISRGGAAALIHQALVYQNKLEPLPQTAEISQYILAPTETP